MSRLADRVAVDGCRALTAGMLHDAGRDSGEVTAEFRAGLTDRGVDPTPEAIRSEIRTALTVAHRASASVVFDADDLDGAVVIAADDAARYCLSLPAGTDLTDVVATVAPPFPKYWIEFHGVANPLNLRAWGLLFQVQQTPADDNPAFPDAAWVLGVELIGEWRKGQPVGPIMGYQLLLDGNGELIRNEQGRLNARLVPIEGMEDTEAQDWGNHFSVHLTAGLFAVSLMHCKNVDLQPVDPPAKVSKKAARRHGKPLTRYYVLVVDQMRRALDQQGDAQASGLRHALHICRGHFKSFTDDAPLFGRHTGTYWWAAHTRGIAEVGTVTKDYRIRVETGGLGDPYQPADEHPNITAGTESKGRDPDLAGRGLAAHNQTQNLLAEAVTNAGLSPRRPKPHEPQYDLAWETPDAVWVTEVKSTTAVNEERQLRLAVGQVLRYRQLLDTDRPVHAVIAIEQPPFDPTWIDLCAQQDITLTWVGAFHDTISTN